MTSSPHVTIDFDPSSVKKHVAQGYNIVAVDVLRATSTIVVALAQGAKEVIPCAEIEEAKLYQKSENALLIGERNAEIVPGFDFTNSPVDLSQEDLTGKIIAITTSTGTKVIVEGIGANNILIGSTLNARSVAEKMQQIKGNWAVIGAGTRGEFRLEDQVGCALIAHYYSQLEDIKIDPNTQNIINTYTQNVEMHIRNSPSTKKLIQIGRKSDVDFVISALNKYEIVPIVQIKKQGKSERLSITRSVI